MFEEWESRNTVSVGEPADGSFLWLQTTLAHVAHNLYIDQLHTVIKLILYNGIIYSNDGKLRSFLEDERNETA